MTRRFVFCNMFHKPCFHLRAMLCCPGLYNVAVRYAEMDITGSPFCVQVFDPSQVRVGVMPQGILGKCFSFERKSQSCKQTCANMC